jgi:hypothetical protein
MVDKLNNLGNRILNISETFDDVPSSVDNEPRKSGKLNPRQYRQMMNFLVRDKKKDSIGERRVPLKKKSDTKVPPKFAKSDDDLKDEFEVIEIPIIMKEFEQYLLNNPSKDFQDFLKDQKLINKKQKKQLDDMILSGALAKIDDRMSGIMQLARGGIIRDPSFTYYNSGGKAKRPPPIKRLNISDYFRYGMTVAELTPYERKVVSDLIKKSFPKSSTDN